MSPVERGNTEGQEVSVSGFPLCIADWLCTVRNPSTGARRGVQEVPKAPGGAFSQALSFEVVEDTGEAGRSEGSLDAHALS